MGFRLELQESAWQSQVEQLLSFQGWKWLHIDRSTNDRGYWRTPVRGPIGPGFPDLMAVRDSRVLFIELKANGKHPTVLQQEVLTVLSHIPGAEVYVWHPSQWEDVVAILSSPRRYENARAQGIRPL